jgi:arylsulfatase A
MKLLLPILTLVLALIHPVSAQTGSPTVVVQQPDGIVFLHSSNAVVHGSTLRYESQTNKICLGYWTNPQDWAEWNFEIKTPGTYTVEVTQGCGKGQGGSEVNAEIGGKTLPFVVKDTGAFQNWEAVNVGTVTLETTGAQTLAIKPQNKKKAAVMDIHWIRLVPVVAKPAL